MSPQEMFIHRMRQLRRMRQLTQEDLAKRSGVMGRATLAKLESIGTPQVRLNQAVAIAGALGVSLDTMLTPEEIVVEVVLGPAE